MGLKIVHMPLEQYEAMKEKCEQYDYEHPSLYTQEKIKFDLIPNFKKDHEIAGFVNDLKDIAVAFGHTQMLRDKISGCVIDFLRT